MPHNVINGNASDNTLIGTSTHDTINGFAGNDILNGKEDNDILNGGAHSDTLDGGTGNDQLNGGTGDDTLDGWIGNDILNGGDENDYLRGWTGNDQLNGGNGNDTLNGGFNDDQLDGGDGNDTADYSTALGGVTVDIGISSDGKAQNTGGAGIDTLVGIESLTGSKFNDILSGDHLISEFNSTFNGEAGDDSLFLESSAAILNGGAGNDRLVVDDYFGTLNGGDGNDQIEVFGNVNSSSATVNGGAGADIIKLEGFTAVTCDYNSVNDSRAGAGRDVIDGFVGDDLFGTDHQIDLSTIDANALVDANQAFTYIGSAAFTAAGQLRYAGGILQGNTSGSTGAEFEIELVGAPALFVQAGNPASDILL